MRRCLAAMALVVVSASLAGCFDQRNVITFNVDGSLTIETEVRTDKEMKDVAAAIEAYAVHAPKGRAAKDGLCLAAKELAKEHAGQTLTVRQFVDAKNFVCIFKQQFASAEDAEHSYLSKSKFLRIRSSGTRRYMISLDFGAMRSASALIEVGAIAGLQHSLGISDPAEAEALYEKLRSAYAAVIKMMSRNREIVFEVRGAQVLDSNGALSGDGTSALFRFTWTDMFDAFLRRDGTPAKTYFVEVAY